MWPSVRTYNIDSYIYILKFILFILYIYIYINTINTCYIKIKNSLKYILYKSRLFLHVYKSRIVLHIYNSLFNTILIYLFILYN